MPSPARTYPLGEPAEVVRRHRLVADLGPVHDPRQQLPSRGHVDASLPLDGYPGDLRVAGQELPGPLQVRVDRARDDDGRDRLCGLDEQ